VLLELEREPPLEELAELLREKVVTGYRHAGFPEAEIDIRTNGNAGSMIVNVREDTRYRAGKLRIDEAVLIPTDDVLTALTAVRSMHARGADPD